jgi:transposase-like protein
VRSCNGKLNRALTQFGSLQIEQRIEPECVEPFMQNKAALLEQIEALRTEISAHKAARKHLPRHIKVQDLPDDQRFRQLSTMSKHFVDTIKKIAYRSETAMANILREHISHPDEARTRLRALYTTEVDLLPDYE